MRARLLPPALREFAGLDKSVVLIGQGNKFEVWAEEAWTARRAEWLGEAGDEDAELPDELGSLSL
jgi:MraZ protein